MEIFKERLRAVLVVVGEDHCADIAQRLKKEGGLPWNENISNSRSVKAFKLVCENEFSVKTMKGGEYAGHDRT